MHLKLYGLSNFEPFDMGLVASWIVKRQGTFMLETYMFLAEVGFMNATRVEMGVPKIL